MNNFFKSKKNKPIGSSKSQSLSSMGKLLKPLDKKRGSYTVNPAGFNTEKERTWKKGGKTVHFQEPIVNVVEDPSQKAVLQEPSSPANNASKVQACTEPKRNSLSISSNKSNPDEKVPKAEREKSSKTASSFSDSLSQNSIVSATYFFGYLSAADAGDLLPNVGQFLVRCKREVDDGKKRTWFITVRDSRKNLQHIPIYQNCEGQYIFNGDAFGTMSTLIQHLKKNPLQLSGFGRPVLTNTVPRPDWLIKAQHLDFVAELGRGRGGQVWKASLILGRIRGTMPVAVKLIEKDLPPANDAVRTIQHEANILRNFNHENIVKFVGIVVENYPPWIVTELCTQSLKKIFIDKIRHIGTTEKLNYCYQAALAFEYIAHKEYVYRDIAARNCLINNDQLKVADFGLARKGKTYVTPDNEAEFLPWRTTPPESFIKKTFSEKSDVWSYGIFLWEVFSDGAEPYADAFHESSNWQENMLLKIMDGYRMEPPKKMPKKVLALMKACWDGEPVKRPTFSEIVKVLSDAKNPSWFKQLGSSFFK